MSWLRRSDRGDRDGDQPVGGDTRSIDPRVAARRRSRLERRIANLEIDIDQAISAGKADSRWRKRIEEINGAIRQAEADLARLRDRRTSQSKVGLDPIPVTDIEVQATIPARVMFQIGSEVFVYSEEIDWTERGERRTLPGLRRFEGQPEALIPAGLPADRRKVLEEHLLHALGALAVALQDELVGPDAKMTLADLASPCPECGNWRDHRDRCISCQRCIWRAAEVQSEIQRLTDERNRIIEDIANQREALPILQRQLSDARRELEKYALE